MHRRKNRGHSENPRDKSKPEKKGSELYDPRTKQTRSTNLFRNQVFLQRILCRSQKIHVGPLTPKLEERILPLVEIQRRDDRHLKLPLQPFDQLQKLVGGQHGAELQAERHVKVCFERDVIEEHGGRDVDLRLWTVDRDDVRGGLFVGESDGRVGFALDVMNEDRLFSEKRSVVLPGDRHTLDSIILILQTFKD